MWRNHSLVAGTSPSLNMLGKDLGRKMQDTDSQKTQTADEIPPRALIGLVASILVLLSATFWTYRVGREANLLDHELSHMTEHIEEAKESIKKLELEPLRKSPTQTKGGIKQ